MTKGTTRKLLNGAKAIRSAIDHGEKQQIYDGLSSSGVRRCQYRRAMAPPNARAVLYADFAIALCVCFTGTGSLPLPVTLPRGPSLGALGWLRRMGSSFGACVLYILVTQCIQGVSGDHLLRLWRSPS